LFIALDVKGDRLYRGARAAIEEEISNICFVRARVEELKKVFPHQKLTELWLTFPDPYPRKGDADKRLTAKKFLILYAKVLRPDSNLHLKTDDEKMFNFSLTSLRENGWEIIKVSRDLHGSDEISETTKIMTSYEERFVREGKKINYLVARVSKHQSDQPPSPKLNHR
jgi:tRNA (guanine-N7-)-methyltransferase